jgi:hypothetical protein
MKDDLKGGEGESFSFFIRGKFALCTREVKDNEKSNQIELIANFHLSI